MLHRTAARVGLVGNGRRRVLHQPPPQSSAATLANGISYCLKSPGSRPSCSGCSASSRGHRSSTWHAPFGLMPPTPGERDAEEPDCGELPNAPRRRLPCKQPDRRERRPLGAQAKCPQRDGDGGNHQPRPDDNERRVVQPRQRKYQEHVRGWMRRAVPDIPFEADLPECRAEDGIRVASGSDGASAHVVRRNVCAVGVPSKRCCSGSDPCRATERVIRVGNHQHGRERDGGSKQGNATSHQPRLRASRSSRASECEANTALADAQGDSRQGRWGGPA